MTDIQAGLTVLTVLVVPYIVQAIKTKAMTGNGPLGGHCSIGAVRRIDGHGRGYAD